MSRGISRPVEKEVELFDGFFAGINGILEFLWEWQWWILFFVILGIGFHFFRKSLLKKQKSLEKSWIYTLFFLTKRQMLIPLIYTLVERQGRASDKALHDLVALRNQAREKNFRDHPADRLQLEKEVSKIIYGYFITLEKAGVLAKDPKLMRIAEDLEFIDSKLIELQEIYNKGVKAWNWKAQTLFWMKPFGVKTFEVFE